jgi:FixJ family two-component response regulator
LDRDLDNIKIKILVFQGKNDLKVYLEWEKKGWVDFLLSPLLW